MKNTALHIIFGVIAFATGLTFVAAIRLVMWLLPAGAKKTAPAEAPPSILRPVENVRQQELSCYDLNIAPIWSELKRDATVQARLAAFPGQYDCSELLEVKLEDLNGDRQPEFIVRGKNIQFFCSATANCNLWVFGQRNGRMKQLLHSGGIDVKSGEATHNGYRNISVRHNGSNHPDHLYEYRFEGSEFQLARCYEQDKRVREEWVKVVCE